MSMTRAEAIERLEKLIALYEMASTENKMIDYSGIIDALKFSLAALRPVSREQVEGIRGEWMFPIFANQEDANDPRWQCSECGSIETPLARHRFCPSCGAPMTDEAVQMVMERLEAQHGET